MAEAIGLVISGIVGAGMMGMIIHLIKNKVGVREADIYRKNITAELKAVREVSDLNDSHIRSDLRNLSETTQQGFDRTIGESKAIRKGISIMFAHMTHKPEKMRELIRRSGVVAEEDLGNMSLVVDNFIDELNGD